LERPNTEETRDVGGAMTYHALTEKKVTVIQRAWDHRMKVNELRL